MIILGTREELHQMDQRTSKLMTIHKGLPPRDDIERLYPSRKGEERGLANIDNGVDTSIRRLEDYIKKGAEEDLLQRQETTQTTL